MITPPPPSIKGPTVSFLFFLLISDFTSTIEIALDFKYTFHIGIDSNNGTNYGILTYIDSHLLLISINPINTYTISSVKK